MAEYLHHPSPRESPKPSERPPPSAPDPGPAESGQKGHMRAVLRHRLSGRELAALREAPWPKLCIHGRYDLVARVRSSAGQLFAASPVPRSAHIPFARLRPHAV